MARCIEKYDFLALLHHLMCADMLGDTARFLRSDMGLANRVKQRSLPWSTWPMTVTTGERWTNVAGSSSISGIAVRVDFWWQFFHGHAEFAGNQTSCIKIDFLVDCCHDAEHHQLFSASLTSRPSLIANSLTDKDSPTLICVGLTGSCLTAAGAGPAERLPAAPGRDCCPCIGGLLKPGRFPPGVGFRRPGDDHFSGRDPVWPQPHLALHYHQASVCRRLPVRDCPVPAGRLNAGRC